MENERMLNTADGPPSPTRRVAAQTTEAKGVANLALCFIGLQASYLTWGIMQEKIMTTQFEPTPLVPDGIFPSATFCVFSNRFLAIIVATLLTLKTHGTMKLAAPLWYFSPCALSNTISSWGQYAALKYVSFPLQVRPGVRRTVGTAIHHPSSHPPTHSGVHSERCSWRGGTVAIRATRRSPLATRHSPLTTHPHPHPPNPPPSRCSSRARRSSR